MASHFCDCGPDQLPALMAFWARVYRPDYILCRDEALFRWQFSGPSGAPDGGFHVKLAIVDGDIVGCLGYIPVEVSLGPGVAAGAWLANWVVDPDRRHLGVGPLLMRQVTSQFDVTLNAGPNQEARSVLTRMAWRDMGRLTRYVRVLDADATGTLLPDGRLEWPAMSPNSTAAISGVTIVPVTRFSDEMTDLWDRLSPGLGAGTRRSAAYLNWRYAGHPALAYRCFEARRNGQLTGAAVYRIEHVRDRPVRLGRLVELFAEERDAPSLAEAIVSDARAGDVAALDFFCSSPLLAAPLSASGFLSGEESPAARLPMLFQPLDHRRSAIHFMARISGLPEAAAVSRWYVTKSDADQDRPN